LLDGITVGVTTLPVVSNAVSPAVLIEDGTADFKEGVIGSGGFTPKRSDPYSNFVVNPQALFM